ncbi:MAG: hypothetical protein ACI9HE_000378 [Planctomycetota bacterium]|jgi:hypothetical protein
MGMQTTPAKRSPAQIELILTEFLGRDLCVSLGKSRTQPVRATREGNAWSLRLHAAFAEAPHDLLLDLGRWLKAGRRARAACQRLDDWIAEAITATPAPAPRASNLQPRGKAYNLTTLADPILAQHLAHEFGAELLLPAITWGRRGRSSSRYSLRLGSFDPSMHLIRVHPVLDQLGVPEWFTSFVLFHELLHAVYPPVKTVAGRWIHHGRLFRLCERAHPDFARATKWEREHISTLIRSARTGTPLPLSCSEPERLQGQLF